jgi:hypothetical protein
MIATSSAKYGIWDGDAATVISIFLGKKQAVEELTR